MLLEIEEPVAENTEALEHIANVISYSAEVFTDDDVFVSDTLERENTHQVCSMIAHIRALACLHRFGNPE